MDVVSYGKSNLAWREFSGYVESLIITHRKRRVLEIGGGANPTLPLELVARLGITYTILDISPEELGKAPDGYRKELGDACAKDLRLSATFDFVFSKMLAEHVPSGQVFHENMFRLLDSEGMAFHFFPTLYAVPFALNRIVPEWVSDKIVNVLQSGREQAGPQGKFPAYYDWCYGPTKRQIERFRAVGFEVIQYRGFFGHDGYYKSNRLLLTMHRAISSLLNHYPSPLLTSFAYVLLKKPTEGINEKLR